MDELGVCGKVLVAGGVTVAPMGRGQGQPCVVQSLPARFRMDPSQAKAEPISKVVGTSVYLKNREKLQSKEISEKKGAPGGKHLCTGGNPCPLCPVPLLASLQGLGVASAVHRGARGVQSEAELGKGRGEELFTVCANLCLFASQYLSQ